MRKCAPLVVRNQKRNNFFLTSPSEELSEYIAWTLNENNVVNNEGKTMKQSE